MQQRSDLSYRLSLVSSLTRALYVTTDVYRHPISTIVLTWETMPVDIARQLYAITSAAPVI